MTRALSATNVHQLLPLVLNLFKYQGVRRESRNGPVLQLPGVTAFEYARPWQRVMFWPERDCNPALHLYESLWMLRGRNDVEPLVRYAKQFNNYTDDGKTMHGAYGHRWRKHFGRDQLIQIAEQLKRNGDDRRAVLQMWDARVDLGRNGKDLPCNLLATFQLNYQGHLEMVVYNRSNDAIWGALGANAVHFSFLQEYLANIINVQMGSYTQVSSNMHGYLNTLEPLAALERAGVDPYENRVTFHPLPIDPAVMDSEIEAVVAIADGSYRDIKTSWGKMASSVLYANHLWRVTKDKNKRYETAMTALREAPSWDITDWCVAQAEWFERRERKFREKGGE